MVAEKKINHEQIYTCLIYLAFAVLIFIKHIPMSYVSDDMVMALGVVDESLWEHFVLRYFQNGRICTDVLANVFYRMPMMVWKVFDTGVYVAIAMLLSYLFTKNTYKCVLVTCVLISLYPFEYLSSAGYIATSTNYVYTILGILLILVPIKRNFSGQKVPVFMHIISFVSMIYVTNHDQTAMVLIGGLLLSVLYAYRMKDHSCSILKVYLIVAICMYIFMFFMPGHINRMNSTAEMEYWLPQYAEWSFLEKLYHGYSATVAQLIFNNEVLFILFLCLLFVLALKSGGMIHKIIGFIPLSVIFFVNIVGRDKFVHYDFVLPDLLPLTHSTWSWVPLTLSIIVIFCVFYTVCQCVTTYTHKMLMLLLLVLAAGSREMMGFSATIYASSYRTFTVFLYCLMVCCLLLVQEFNSGKNVCLSNLYKGEKL